MPIPNIKPGDLIDANQLLAFFRELDARIHTLELASATNPLPTQGQVVITQLIPATEIHIGDELRIIGSEFYYSQGAARVLLNGQQRTIKSVGSSDTELRIDIPLGTTLGPATVRVTNSFTFAERPINILASQAPLTGNAQVTFLSVSPTQINIGTTAPVRHTFHYELDTTGTSRAATYVIEPFISVPLWDGTAHVVDESGQGFHLSPGQKVNFAVTVDLGVATGTPSSFATRIDLTAEDRIWHLADRTFTNGETVLPTDPGVRLGAPHTAPTTSFNDTTNTITGAATLMMQADFTAVGVYALIGRPVNGSPIANSHWTVDPDATPQTVDVTQAKINAGGGRHRVAIGIIFTPTTGAQPVDIEVGYGIAGSTKTVDHFTLTP